MKKILALFLAILMFLEVFVACDMVKEFQNNEEHDEDKKCEEQSDKNRNETEETIKLSVARWGLEATTHANKIYEISNDESGFSIEHSYLIPSGGNDAFSFITFLKGNPEIPLEFNIISDVKLSGCEIDGRYCCPLSVTVNGVTKKGNEFESVTEFESWIEKQSKFKKEYFVPEKFPEGEKIDFNIAWEWDVLEGCINDANDTSLQENLKDIEFQISIIQTMKQIITDE